MLHVRPYLNQGLRLGGKWDLMSYIQASERSSVISSVCVVPNGSAKFALKLPASRRSDLQVRLLMAVTMSSMVEVKSGAMYHPKTFHHFRQISSCNMKCFWTWRQSNSRVKCSALQ